MKILKQDIPGFRYAFESEYSLDLVDFCRYIKKQVGNKNFYWDASGKKWRFNDLSVFEMLNGRYPEVEIDASMDDDVVLWRLKKEEERIIEGKNSKLKHATDSSIVINGLKDDIGTPYPYQKVGVEFLVNSKGRGIIADGMGLGKSLQALAYIVHEGIEKSLIICPSSVKYSWDKEVKGWTSLKPYVFRPEDKFDDRKDIFDVVKNHDIFIINYDLLKKHQAIVTAFKWGVLVCDEFHYIKNPTAQRTKLVKAIARGVPRVIMLSGTPMMNRPVELFSGLNIIDPNSWPDWFEFTKRYCQGHRGQFGWDARGASHIEELREKIQKYYIRRQKEEVLKELPPKTFIDVPVEMNNEFKFEYKLIEDDFVQYLKEKKNKTEEEVNKSLQAEKLVKLGELRHITSMSKIKAAEDLIDSIVETGEKVVVFSVYKEPLEHLKFKYGKSCVLISGDVPDVMRGKYIEQFQNDSSKKVFLGGMKSAGVGITLTAAANVVFLDFSWVPSDHEQAQDRAHRIGQKADHVNVYQLYSMETIDEYMKELLDGKKDLISQIIDGKPAESGAKSIVGSLLDIIEKEKIST